MKRKLLRFGHGFRIAIGNDRSQATEMVLAAGESRTTSPRARQELAIAESQVRDYQVRLGKPFPHESYQAGLAALRDDTKLCLSGRESGGEEKPDAPELAERIKTLKAAHTVEGTVQRLGKRRGAAEEPVTARIRR